MDCSIGDAAAFGRGLAHEMRLAEESRARAGEPGPDDYGGAILHEADLP
jgi:hypothetical protein